MVKEIPTIIPGTRYGHLTVTGQYKLFQEGNRKRNRIECLCDCGKMCYPRKSNLKEQNVCSFMCKYNTIIKHGYSCRVIHTKSKRTTTTREYNSWFSMKQRCNNPSNARYKNIGGRGIIYSPEFENFDSFIRIMGDAPTTFHRFTRIDKDSDFEPGNVHWYLATKKKKK